MSLDLGETLRDGASRTVELNALVLMAGFVVLGLASLAAQQTFVEWYVGWLETVAAETGEPMPTEVLPDPSVLPLSFGLSLSALAPLWLALALLAEAYRIVAVRTMVSDHTDHVPREFVTRNIARVTLNGFVGGVVVAALVGLGSLLLVVPGIFLAVSFLFVRQEIAVRDVNFVDAMAGSWELSRGNRVELAVLGVVWITVSLLVLLVNGGLSTVLPEGSVVAAVPSVVLSAPVTVFVVATASRAYVQLADGRDDDPGAAGDDADEEWPDPPGVDI